jgi:hypothetical protein
MAEIEKFGFDKRLKSLDEFDQEPIYVMPDAARPQNWLVVAAIGLVAGMALGFGLIAALS